MENEALKKAINSSGFTLELDCINKLKNLGFSVQPSLNFFDYFRNKNTEIDMRAVKVKSIRANENVEISCCLTMGIECKKFTQPLVVFNVTDDKNKDDDNLDADSFYCHINTSRDKSPNYFIFPLLDAHSTGINVKENHHYFNRDTRYYNITQLEKKESKNNPDYFKLHVPDHLKYVIEKLGSYSFNFNKKWFNTVKESKFNLEDVSKTPVINVLFLLLVHSSDQFQYNHISKELTQHHHLTTFSNVESATEHVKFIVDIVNINDLELVIQRIEQSYNYMLKHLIKWFVAQR